MTYASPHFVGTVALFDITHLVRDAVPDPSRINVTIVSFDLLTSAALMSPCHARPTITTVTRYPNQVRVLPRIQAVQGKGW